MFTKEEHEKLTQLKNSNKDFAYFIDKLTNDNRLLTSQISHEIRNPLTLIKSTAQLIETRNPEIKEVNHWGHLIEDINGLESLLTELSVYNNSDSVHIQNQNFLLLLKSILNSFNSYAEQKGVDLSLNITEEELPYYSNYPLDQVKIKQVFTNIIRNAFDATKEGEYVKLDCKVFPSSHLVISVINNGKMIPADELPTIFQPFVTYKSGGSGLGLAISSNIIAAHNGTISVSSAEEKTSFDIQLPLNE
jgi:signal transduction histidine kinase